MSKKQEMKELLKTYADGQVEMLQRASDAPIARLSLTTRPWTIGTGLYPCCNEYESTCSSFRQTRVMSVVPSMKLYQNRFSPPAATTNPVVAIWTTPSAISHNVSAATRLICGDTDSFGALTLIPECAGSVYDARNPIDAV